MAAVEQTPPRRSHASQFGHKLSAPALPLPPFSVFAVPDTLPLLCTVQNVVPVPDIVL